LSDFDDIAVGIPHVAPDLEDMVLGLGEEFGSFASPVRVGGLDIRDPQVKKAGDLVRVPGWPKRDGWLVVGRSASHIQDQPGVGNLKDGRLAFTNQLAAKDSKIKVSRALHILDREKVRYDEAFSGREREVSLCRTAHVAYSFSLAT
jgi:hypothetical protein